MITLSEDVGMANQHAKKFNDRQFRGIITSKNTNFLIKSHVQSNPTIMDPKGLTIFSIIHRLLLLLINKIKESSFLEQKNCIHYRRNYFTSGSSIAGFDCILKTELNFKTNGVYCLISSCTMIELQAKSPYFDCYLELLKIYSLCISLSSLVILYRTFQIMKFCKCALSHSPFQSVFRSAC